MQDAFLTTVNLIFGGLALALLGLAFKLKRTVREKDREIIKEREESQRRIYELAILKEIGERVGYSLNAEEILQIISGSLRQFIDYSAVSYIVVAPEKLKMNIHLEQSVDKSFLAEMKERMLASLAAILDKPIPTDSLEEVVSGAISLNDLPQAIGSFFNIPLSIGGNLAGLLTIAHINRGLYKEADMTILYKITAQASEAVSRLQEVIKIEERKLNAMVESMGEGVLMVDNEYRVTVVNPKAKALIDFHSNRDISIFDFIEGLGGKFDIRGRLEAAIIKGDEHVSERTAIKENFYEIGVYPVRSKLGKEAEKSFGAVVVFHDITKDYELERVREDFTSMIVHELRSPLDGMRKIIELIVSGKIKKTSPQFKEYMGMVHQSSTSMLELVSDILDYSKLQAGKFEINKELVNVRDVVENRISFYKALADTKNIKLLSFTDKNVPEHESFDERGMKQVLNNFISNSLKFTPAGGFIDIVSFVFNPGEPLPQTTLEKIHTMPVKIDAEDLKTGRKSLVMAVFDNGIGIPAEKTKDLFVTYKQAGASPLDPESKGTGLGLVIVQGIIEAHGGFISAKSEEKVGSVFYFAIPV